ncbi:hypothetical protein [Calothrix sp. NIES-2098]|uniref:hypothetical protein n=1 Tax=Calothrix sp. NIES-2098 TaxID=1954171 RepID=UPI000B5EE67C|nr:hypothetical protein NIES2098_18580 [Calothrix sp. NIES-2098]
MKDLTLDQAIQSAIELNASVSKEGLKVAFPELRKAIEEFEDDGYPIETIIPQEEEVGLGFSLKSTDVERFWEIYSDLIRKSLCGSNGDLHKLVQSGISTSVGAVLATLVTGLGIPAAALGIMVPIAVIIVNIGVDAFCIMTEQEN